MKRAWMSARGRWVLAALVVAALQTAAIIGCATNPVTGKREFSLVSPQQELEMGRQGNDAVLAEYGVYDERTLQAYVDSIGQRVARASDDPQLEWHFTLIDDPVVNAFALPGGYIYVTRGILAYLNSEAQLAGVLGHEIGHVTARHTARRITQQQLAGLGLGIASIVSPTFQRYGNLAQQALGLLFLKYSRADETQADDLGVKYATRAGYDPREIPATYRTLKRVGERSGQSLPSFLSTHPDPGDREARTREEAQQAAAGKTGLRIDAAGHVRRLEGLVFGNDPRQGYFDGARFVHPQLGFEMEFPSGWQTQNTHQAVLAAEPNQTAGMQLTLADTKGLSPTAFVEQLRSQGRVLDARGGGETIGGWPAWVGRLTVPNQDGSQAVLDAAFVQPTSARTFQVLGQAASGAVSQESAIFASMRSLRAIDPSRRNPTPARVDIVTATQAGTLQSLISRSGTQGVDADEIAIMNDLQLGDTVDRGRLVKLVKPGSR